MAHRQGAVEATPTTLRPDMSLRELLSAVAAGQVFGGAYERGGDWINLWSGTAERRPGLRVTPWEPTGRRLDFAHRRGLLVTGPCGKAELTTLGWHRFEQLVRPLTAEESERRSCARQPRDPRTEMRWRYSGTAKAARCHRNR